MTTIMARLKALAMNDRGATAIEYALIASILGLSLMPVISSTSSGIGSLFDRVQGYFEIINGSG